MNKKYIIIAALGIALALPILTLAKGVFVNGLATATATSTLQYMTPGTGTTTLTYNSFPNGQTTTDQFGVLVRFTASSTNSTLLINQEFSMDGIDWYQGNVTTLTNNNSTTTLPVNIGQVPQLAWQFASSTAGLGAIAATNNSDTRFIELDNQTILTRLVFTMKLGGTNGAVWAQVVPIKQNP